jgi:phosphinothricin acetyltransferase
MATRSAAPASAAFTIRPATEDDDAAIAAIWNHEVLHGDATFDTTERTAAEQVEWRRAHDDRHSLVVGVVGDEVVAYGTLSPYRSKPTYRFTVEDAVYVRSTQRGRGWGGRMLGHLVALAEARGFHAVMARITGGNDASVRLHERHGFRLVGVEREIGFKFGRWKDVVLMQRLLSDRGPPEVA